MQHLRHRTVGREGATLEQTLQVFRALLKAEGSPAIGDADEAIWAYLTPVQGLRAGGGVGEAAPEDR